MDANRKQWNDLHQELHDALAHAETHDQAIDLFLRLHAMVHTAAMSEAGLWSFEDDIWQGTSETIIRRIPKGGEHSIAWVLWHSVRIEDVTMSLLVAGCPQLYTEENWADRMKTPYRHAGNAMSDDEIARLSAIIDIEALRAYRLAVGRRTRDIVRAIPPEIVRQKVDPARLRQVSEQGAVVPEAQEIINYWGGRTIAGLLLMPPTRHNFLHLNEALRLKQKRQ